VLARRADHRTLPPARSLHEYAFSGESVAEAGADGRDCLGLVREALAAEEAAEDAGGRLRCDDVGANEDVELAGLAGLDLDLGVEVALDRGGETRRPGLIASSRAVEDLHVAHDGTVAVISCAHPRSGASEDAVKIGIMFANVGPFGLPDNLAHLAKTAEDAGVESLWTVEHVVVPVGYTAEYPYSADGKMPGPENSPIPDPVLPLAYAAAHTSKIKLGTGILILPQRHPAYVAKEFATLDVLSEGRAILGIGIGWLHEEFATIGVPFDERVGRTEESMQAIRSLWGKSPQPFKGNYYEWDAVESNPKPVQPGGVPIVVGGHVKNAARRAARFGDGFFPVKGDEARIAELIDVVKDECAKIDRDPAEIEITAPCNVHDLDAIKRLQDLGVSRVITGPPAFDRDGVEKGFDKIATEVLAKL